jgi:hypothetical protein
MTRKTCESVPALSIFDLNQWGYLKAGVFGNIKWTIGLEVFEAKVYFTYNHGREVIHVNHGDMNYYVHLTKTPCFFGDFRRWFICPENTCRKRVGILYKTNSHFLCRDCGNLAYQSQNVSHSSGKRFWYYLRRAIGWGDKINDTRVKYYQGKPTKRYQLRLQNHDEAACELNEDDI